MSSIWRCLCERCPRLLKLHLQFAEALLDGRQPWEACGPDARNTANAPASVPAQGRAWAALGDCLALKLKSMQIRQRGVGVGRAQGCLGIYSLSSALTFQQMTCYMPRLRKKLMAHVWSSPGVIKPIHPEVNASFYHSKCQAEARGGGAQCDTVALIGYGVADVTAYLRSRLVPHANP